MKIHVRTPKSKKTIDTQEKALVEELKTVISATFNVPVKQVCLIFGGKILEDQATLDKYGIGEGTTISLTISYPKFTCNPEELPGERIRCRLVKPSADDDGVGVGLWFGGSADDKDQFLQITEVTANGLAAREGSLQNGDILVYLYDVCVLGYTGRKLADLIKIISPGEEFAIEACRGYPVLFEDEDETNELANVSPPTSPPPAAVAVSSSAAPPASLSSAPPPTGSSSADPPAVSSSAAPPASSSTSHVQPEHETAEENQEGNEQAQPQGNASSTSSDKYTKKTRSKKFSDEDFELAKQLLKKHDPYGLTGSNKWAGGAREKKQEIREAIFRDFIGACRRKNVTMEQLIRLLESVRRKEKEQSTSEELDAVQARRDAEWGKISRKTGGGSGRPVPELVEADEVQASKKKKKSPIPATTRFGARREVRVSKMSLDSILQQRKDRLEKGAQKEMATEKPRQTSPRSPPPSTGSPAAEVEEAISDEGNRDTAIPSTSKQGSQSNRTKTLRPASGTTIIRSPTRSQALEGREEILKMREEMLEREKALQTREAKVSAQEELLDREKALQMREASVAAKESLMDEKMDILKQRDEVSKAREELSKQREDMAKREYERARANREKGFIIISLIYLFKYFTFVHRQTFNARPAYLLLLIQ